jgi:hypothetical protein
MIKLVLRNSNGDLEETQISNDMILNPSQGEHYYFTGVSSYTFNLTDNDNTLDVYFIDNDGNRIHVVLQDLAQLIQLNNPMDVFSLDTIFGVSTNSEGDKQIEEALNNPEFESGEIVNALKEALSMDGSTLASGAIIDDFQSLLNMLDAAAAGGPEDTAYLSPLEESSQQEVTLDGGTTRPESPDDVTLTTTDIPTDAADYNATITLGDISASEGSTDVTISATVDNPPLTDLVITLDNGATITILAGQTSGTSTPFAVQGDDVYVDPGTETVTVSSTTGGGYDNLTIDGSATITVNDTIDDTTLSISGPASVEEGTTAVYTLNITNPPLEDMLIDVEITNKADGPSNNPANGDVETEIIQVLIRAGETSSDPFTVDINDDNYIENPEDYQLEIIGYTGGNEFENLVIGESVTTAITDESVPTNPDDQTAYVSIEGPATVVEGAATTDYTVSITEAPTSDLTVYFTYSGEAEDGTDYTSQASVVIKANETSATFDLATIDDNLAEISEKFTVSIDGTKLGTVGGLEDVRVDSSKASVETTITDEAVPTDPDDQTAYVSIEGPATVVEGAATTDYTVSITEAPTSDLTVYFTYSGEAEDGTDYTSQASVVIKANETSATFDLATIDDNLAEISEKFTVSIDGTKLGTVGGLEDVRVDSSNNSVETTIIDDTTTVSVTDGAVDEAALMDGSDPESDNETTTGTFTISTGNDTLSQLIVAGEDVTNGGTVTGDYGILTVIEDNGTYSWTYTLTDNTTDHTSQGANIDGIKDDFTVVVKDSNGATSEPDILTVTVKDDIVTANDSSVTVEVAASVFNANVVLTLDYSGSMDSTELGQQADAAIALLDKYQATLDSSGGGDVKVMVVKFASTATTNSTVWMSISEAKAYIEAGNPNNIGSYTNYDDALKTIIENYSEDGKVTVDGTINSSYYMTDGTPTASNGGYSGTDGITSGYAAGTDETSTVYVGTNGEVGQGNWEAFLEANELVSYAIGIGSVNTTSYLEPIAYNGVTETQDHDTLLQSPVDFDKIDELLVSLTPDVQIEGTLNIDFGADGAATDVTAFTWGDADPLNGLSEITVTGNNDPISWEFVSGSTTLIVGKIGDETVIKVEATGIGTDNPKYNISELDTTSGIETISIPYVVTDGDGDTATSNLNIVIPDEKPESVGESQTLLFGESTTNLLFTLDVSGSMKEVPQGSSDSRFEIAKASIIATILEYAQNGETEVSLTLFNSGAENYGWMTTDEAVAFLNKLTMNTNGDILYDGYEINGLMDNSTNYHLGLTETMTIDFTGHDADNTVAYFLSDGEPTSDEWKVDSDTDDTIVAWSNYVSANIDTLNVIGVGSGAAVDSLKIVQVQEGDNVIMVYNDSTLGDVLLGTVNASVSGNVLDNVTGGDGTISVESITVDGVTYYGDNTSDVSTLTTGISIGSQGTLVFDFTTGDYSYSAKASEFDMDTEKEFTVTARDADGDTTSFDVNITVDVIDPVQNTVIANEAGISSDTIEASFGDVSGTSIEITDINGNSLLGQTVVAKVTDTNGNVFEVNAKYLGEELEYQEINGILTAVSKDTNTSVFTISENVADNSYKVTMLQPLDPVTSSVSVIEDQTADISLDTTGGSVAGISVSLSSNMGSVYEDNNSIGINYDDNGRNSSDRNKIEDSEKLIMNFTVNSNIVITSVAVSLSNFDESYNSFFGGYHDGDDASVLVYYAGESNPYTYYVDADNANGITISIPEGKTLEHIDFGTVDSNDEYSIADNITVTYDETTSVTLDNPEQTFEFGAQIINGNDQQFVTFDVTVDNDNTLEADIGDVVVGRDSETIIDTLSIDSDNDTIDFSEIAQNAKDIEAVNFSDGKAQMIENIDLQDVVDMTDDEDDLVIIGENGDEIELKDDLDGDGINDWQTDGQAKELQGYEGTFVEYTNSTVSIFVDTDISVDDTI